jgi:hypothetical protein
MQENKSGSCLTGEKSPPPIFAGIVFEVQKAHRDLYPPAGAMMVCRPGNGVENSL